MENEHKTQSPASIDDSAVGVFADAKNLDRLGACVIQVIAALSGLGVGVSSQDWNEIAKNLNALGPLTRSQLLKSHHGPKCACFICMYGTLESTGGSETSITTGKT